MPDFDNNIDQLIQTALFASPEEQRQARFQIWSSALQKGIIPASINDFYFARGQAKVPLNFTVPAFNIRGLSYDVARAAFQAAQQLQVGALIFEIARSEMAYTDQSPEEYVLVLQAAALRENWSGPLFVQGDHFQAKAAAPGQVKAGEIEAIKDLILTVIEAGFYNIDIDMSTLVDLQRAHETEQQIANIQYTKEITDWVRQHQPAGMTISLGGEIGHIGGKNSTVEDFRAFIDGYQQALNPPKTTNQNLLENQAKIIGLSKISVQTGSEHGGVVNPDGSLQKMKIDFLVLKNISQIARQEYGLGGAVQHGASTLTDDQFAFFPQSETLEVHLATGLQNLVLDHPAFPQELLAEIYRWLDQNKAAEKKTDQTEQQFHYQLRKKAWGHFKKAIWQIDETQKSHIRQSLAERFAFFFKILNVVNSQSLIQQFVKPVIIEKQTTDFLKEKAAIASEDLAD